MRFEKNFFMPHPREAVWDLLADTDRMNREIGVPPIQFTFLPRAAGGTEADAEVHLAGYTMRYREHPFEWLRPYYYTVRRTFHNSPLSEIRIRLELTDEKNGTRVLVVTEIDSRNALGRALAKVVGTKSMADMAAGAKGFGAFLDKKCPTPYPNHARKPAPNRDRLGFAIEKLKQAGADSNLADRLSGFLESAPPEDLVHIRPYALADSWDVSRGSMLECCLHAAKTGLLDLRWRVLCPYCRGGPPGARTLGELKTAVHCETCNIRFDAEFDRSVEVCFAVAQPIRAVTATTYCIGGPQLSQHAAAQWIIPPGIREGIPLRVAPGEYALTSLQSTERPSIQLTESGESEPELQIVRAESGISLNLKSDEIALESAWRIDNRSDETILLRIESPQWSSDTATAAAVTSLAKFRDLFSSEVLSPGVEIAVQQICVLFSDLKGSTAMYRDRGDAASYRMVRDHFEVMRTAINSHNGSVLKTAGDAVMAIFADPAEALESALAIQRDAEENPDGLIVKLGLHWGPAIAVNANDTLDYFGQTVNLAARMQSESEGGDIVLSAQVADDPHVARLLASHVIQLERFEAPIRGLSAPMAMLRVRPLPGMPD